MSKKTFKQGSLFDQGEVFVWGEDDQLQKDNGDTKSENDIPAQPQPIQNPSWVSTPSAESLEEKESPQAVISKQAKRKPTRQRPSLFARAIDALSRREYSQKELRLKLKRSLGEEETLEQLDEVIERLIKLGYLSNQRYAITRVRVRASQFGDSRIRYELREQGVSEEDISEAFSELGQSEDERAYKVWKRRFDALPDTPKERDRQIRYLLYRGFSMSAVDRVIRGRVEVDESDGNYWD